MFVMATVYAGDVSAPVKIRNLSAKGALIEGAQVPPKGAQVSLRRGILAVSGAVAWSSNGRAGVEFESPACVAHWLPGGEELLRQEQIDRIFEAIEVAKDVPSTDPAPSSGPVDNREIVSVKELLEALAEALSNDDEVVARHGARLPALDLATRLLGRLAAK